MRGKTLSIFGAAMVCGLFGAGIVNAQQPGQGDKKEVERSQVLVRQGGGAAVGVGGSGDNTFVFVSSEYSFDSKLVKGAPYSGQAVTETVQTLGDGNRIVRKSSSTVYRDSEGRTRREQSVPAIGPYVPQGDAPVTIFINDPVAKINYILETSTKTARKFALPNFSGRPGEVFQMTVPGPGAGVNVITGSGGTAQVRTGAAAGGGSGGGSGAGAGASASGERIMQLRQQVETAGIGVGGAMIRTSAHQPKVESLGKMTIEGVEAEGTRTTMTIPQGEIGNERQIEIVSERWYSPELQTVVMSKRNDPMSGDMTYRLTNINRSEPASSLFEVPSDYKIKEGPAVREFRFKTEAEKSAAPQ